ncbi:16S rRNA (cytidine(1402)-2'-O)-methyltransferase [Clostridium sp. Cult3]|uniref:16S rRNA (cytidine(1402)-2'-O)-methyltransferase n=1 Tax=Clostridium sp. Cult3 TaxID=2079004 RepID=UPI001F000331|nr:16S rRNA (cytidine(1402)-2'-O)-methyltransferase [Clostridium sp. Cult3]MCF6459448.1 16S rRNA (cytidine(1402)-2'-O)-methyltransferase [Clostridium sp. Cult3]
MSEGILYICPTPIGNLEDITLRTLRALKEVDLIAAEDTRRTIKLLNHYEIKKPLISYHEHNKVEKGKILIEKLKEGVNIALVTDAGMPGISDPGEDMIRLAIENQIEPVVLPGATASITALVLSGLPTKKFVFEGFLPSKKKDRREELERLKTEERTIILYEAPHRLLALLKDMEAILGDRQLAIGRELTKIYEEVFRGSISDALRKFQEEKPRGEFVLVIKGAEISKEDPYQNISIREHLIMYMEEGLTKRDAVKKVADVRDIPKNLVYKESIDI